VRDPSHVEALLSLFTSRDRAEAIAGDLAEERSVRGSAWFWFHVVGTTFALFRRAFASAPLAVSALTVSGCVLFAALAFAGVAAINLFPQFVGSFLSWSVLLLVWWGGALWTGISLVSIAPKPGMPACLAVVLASETVVTALWLLSLWSDGPRAWSVLVYITALFAAAPLLTGAVLVHRRQTA
jgi:hypothetical protein